MRATYHAAERLLQRVFNQKHYTRKDVCRAKALLEKETQNIVATGVKRFVPLPSFSDYVAVLLEDRLITIYPKQYLRDHLHGRRTKTQRSAA